MNSIDCSVYVDAVDNQDEIEPQIFLENQLMNCQMFILVDAQKAVNSLWVKKEIELAKLYSIKMFSIEIDKVEDAIRKNDIDLIYANLSNFDYDISL